MLKKIRFTNPIKNCFYIQGKAYTVSLIAAILALFILAIVATIIHMPIIAVVSAIVGIATTIFYTCWFGIVLPDE